MSQPLPQSDHSTWVETLFRPLVVAVMVSCVALSLVQLVRMVSPTWNPTYLVAGCVLATLDAWFSYRLLRTKRMLGINVLRFRSAELALIFLLLKVGRFVGKSWAEVLAEIQSWPEDLSQVFDLETMAAFALALLCWGAATHTARDLDLIGISPERRAGYTFPVERLMGRFLTGGVVLLIATGLTRLGDASDLLDLRRPSEGGLILNVLAYFFLGLTMLGQVRFVELRKGWQSQGMRVANELARRWVRYSLSFIGLAAVLAFALPTQFLIGLWNELASSLDVIGAILSFILTLLLTIMLLPLSLLLWLLTALFSRGKERPPPAVKMPAFEAPQRPDAGGTMSWLEMVWPLVFWAILLGVVFYVIRSYLRDRPELREALWALRPVQALRRVWVALRRWLRDWFARLRHTVNERLPGRSSRRRMGEGASIRRPLRLFRLGALSPRERVLYYYLSILRRAGRQGFPRHHHQTPAEYQAMLGPNLPQAQQDMGALTQAFVEARYSRREVGPDQDRRVRTSWEQVKAALRAHRRSGGAGEEGAGTSNSEEG